MQKKKCYYCDDKAVNQEHALPKAFFYGAPETTNRIKVPSCKLHNNYKSKYDDYISTLFLASVDCNKWSEDFKKKYSQRLSTKNLSFITDSNGCVEIISEIGNTCFLYMTQMCHAFYYKYKNFSEKLSKKYPHNIACIILQINNDTSNKDNRFIVNQGLENNMQQLITSKNLHSLFRTYDNGIFWYKLIEDKETCCFEMNFYNTIKAYVAFSNIIPIKPIVDIFNVSI